MWKLAFLFLPRHLARVGLHQGSGNMKCHCAMEASPQSCSYGEVPWCIPHHSTSTPPKGPPCQPHSNLSHSRSQKRGRAKDLDTAARAPQAPTGESSMQWSITGWTEYMAGTRVAGEQGAMRESCKLERTREQEYRCPGRSDREEGTGVLHQSRGAVGPTQRPNFWYSLPAGAWLEQSVH